MSAAAHHLCLIKGMSKEYFPPQKKASGNPYPKRGQIKAGIFTSIAKTPLGYQIEAGSFTSIARTLASLATTKGEGKDFPPQKKASGNPYPKRGQIKAGIFTSMAKTPLGYQIEAGSFTSIAKTLASLATTKGEGKDFPPQKKAYGNPYPNRGQIKAGIFTSIAKTLLEYQIKVGIFTSIAKTLALLDTTKGEGKEKGKEGGQGSS